MTGKFRETRAKMAEKLIGTVEGGTTPECVPSTLEERQRGKAEIRKQKAEKLRRQSLLARPLVADRADKLVP
jgi:hypothetical protein